ncbi:hypothetical protein [Cohaesibacter celericrescens]|uniref:Uncharacterized protein n=1 Tax=Cohaesibacter celericrescens TaxID=2067669 RepID=A0A2N5XRI9_9HYPH|nr:hypothetical protein [Cohaesibacter celericrescens]PLW77104.1 hypothetical protein C0081_11150 [Cohaesibacter celericrescens]
MPPYFLPAVQAGVANGEAAQILDPFFYADDGCKPPLAVRIAPTPSSNGQWYSEADDTGIANASIVISSHFQ